MADKIEGIGGGSVPSELEPDYNGLVALSDELSGDDLLPTEELDEVAEYIRGKKANIEDQDAVKEISDLEKRANKLKDEIEELEQEKEKVLTHIRNGKQIAGTL